MKLEKGGIYNINCGHGRKMTVEEVHFDGHNYWGIGKEEDTPIVVASSAMEDDTKVYEQSQFWDCDDWDRWLERIRDHRTLN